MTTAAPSTGSAKTFEPWMLTMFAMGAAYSAFVSLLIPPFVSEVTGNASSAGVVKPHPKILQHVLDRLGVRPEEAIFTDDMPQFTAAAASLGIHSHTFTSPAEFREYLATFGIKVGQAISD